MPTQLATQQRRDLTANRRYRSAFVTIRPYSACLSFGVSCRVNRQYLKCEECYRKNRKCELAPDYKGIDEAIAKAEKLDKEIIDLIRKTARKRTERKY